MANFTLTESDVAILKLMAADYRRRPLNNPIQNPPTDYLPTTTQEYLVRAPIEGIPALNEETTGTGVGSGTSLADDIPGVAQCQVYQVIHTDPPTAEAVPKFLLTVLNFNTFLIPPYAWIQVSREKYGSWLAPILPLITTDCDEVE